MINENTHVQVFPKGHALYENGRVIVTELGTIDPLTGKPKLTEHTLEAWQELQQSQQQ